MSLSPGTVTVDHLDQRYVLTPPQARDAYLVHIILKLKKEREKNSVIVFVQTIKDCQVRETLSERER
jgi:superfamily II DNA/RNA helicase